MFHSNSCKYENCILLVVPGLAINRLGVARVVNAQARFVVVGSRAKVVIGSSYIQEFGV